MRKIDLATLEKNRDCAFGGGCDDCPCGGECEFLSREPERSASRAPLWLGITFLILLAFGIAVGPHGF